MNPDMDPDTETDAEAAAMAQAMGFSSFGAQDRPSKKRRYNSATDARVSVTGSNRTPLGVPSAKTPANTEEIDLQEEDEDEDEDKVEVEGDSTTPLQKASQGSLPPPPAGLPARPAPGIEFVGGSSSQPGGPPAQRQHEEHRQKEYYDLSVNENPWERLEKAMGLETDGDWVPRASRAVAAS
ncbi:hypothetical protein E4U31_004241 [Claviceps sp. LM219 group G6]|nr:hypothetical protein E4U31_004241 [Claviceps sp. LM219 group G6]